jgi:hypothetical protein
MAWAEHGLALLDRLKETNAELKRLVPPELLMKIPSYWTNISTIAFIECGQKTGVVPPFKRVKPPVHKHGGHH